MNNEIYSDDVKITQSERMIHTPSPFARKNLIYAQETGKLKSLKPHSSVRENLDSYLFFIVLDGEGVVATGGKEYKAVKGDAVLLDCRKRYSHSSSGDNPWTIRWIHFNGNLPSVMFQFFQEGNVGSPVFTPAGGIEEYDDMLVALDESLKNKNILSEIKQSEIIGNILNKSIYEVATGKALAIDKEDGVMDDDEFSTLRESVNEHMGEANLVRILSIQYGIQPDRLSELFEEKYGISLTDYIINRQFNKAKELLRFTIKTVEEIVGELGFSSEDEFRKRFIEMEEMTPEDYRKRWAQWIKS